MTPNGQEEFYISVIIWGAVILVGVLLVIVLGAFAWKLRGSLKKKTIIKELYENKERTNGQSKGGSRGSY